MKQRIRKTKNWKRPLFWSIFLLGVIAFGFLLGDYFYHQKHFPDNTYLENVDISGLTQEEAIQEIERTPVRHGATFPIILHAGKDQFAFTPGELGLEVDAGKSVHEAFKKLRGLSFLREWEKRARGGRRAFLFYFHLDRGDITDFLKHFEAIINRPPQDATVVFLKGGGYHLVEEKIGRKLLVEESRKLLEEALAQGKRSAILKIDFSPARITQSMLNKHPPVTLLSKFTTFYGTHDSPNRIHNIQLIASWLDNTMLLSGESFSLVDSVGNFSEERGFKEAFVIIQGELVPQYGGGACQIGTTLYNAASLADLAVRKRRNHSFYFNIYPLGRDATIYPGQLDLLLENDTGYPLLIKTEATNKYLTFRLYGTATDKKVEFSPAKVFMLNEEGQFKKSSLKEVIAMDRPFRTEVVRKVHDKEGKLIKKEVIKSYYKLYGERDNVPIARPEPR